MNRISTANSYDSTLGRLMQRQGELSEAQLQLTSGKRVNRASDDPTNAARAERALATEARLDATKRAVSSSQILMSQTEGALADANELLQQARETLVAAGNASYSDAERKGLSQQLAGIRQQLLAVANRSDGGTGYLFGGQGSAQPPFVDAPGGVAYYGTAGRTETIGDERLPLTLDGRAAWLQARTGNGVFETRALQSNGGAWIDAGGVTDPSALTGSTYTVQFSNAGGSMTYSVLRDGAPTALTNMAYQPGKVIGVDGLSFTIAGQAADGDAFEVTPSSSTLSVFDVIDKAIADLATPSRRGSAVAQSNSENLRNVDSVLSNLQNARAEVGQVLNNIDGVTGRLDSLKLHSQTERSNAEDLDMVSAISEFQSKQSGYDAALKAYSMVQKLSLFQYVNG